MGALSWVRVALLHGGCGGCRALLHVECRTLLHVGCKTLLHGGCITLLHGECRALLHMGCETLLHGGCIALWRTCRAKDIAPLRKRSWQHLGADYRSDGSRVEIG